MEKEPNLQQLTDLYEVCENFIDEHGITCAEAICQQDCVIENAYELIEKICGIVGYAEHVDDGMYEP